VEGNELNRMAVQATLHCLTGCAIGEIAGLVLGTALGWNNATTIIVAITLAFITGYALSSVPLIRGGLALKTALVTVLAADTVSILTMEIVDNAVQVAIPGAMGAGLDNWLFWATLPLALGVAFIAAVPVNKYLLKRGKGHALTHHVHGAHEEHHHE